MHKVRQCYNMLTRWQHCRGLVQSLKNRTLLQPGGEMQYNNFTSHSGVCVWLNERPTSVGLRFGVLDVGWELGEDVISSCVGLSLLGCQFGIPEQTWGQRQETQSERRGASIWIALTPGLKAGLTPKTCYTLAPPLAGCPLSFLTLRSIYNVKNFTGNKRKI